MNPVNSAILWRDLSSSQKKFGLDPKKLIFLRFEKEDFLSESFCLQVTCFFISCRMAVSQTNFLRACNLLYAGQDPVLDVMLNTIKTITGRILFMEMPKESLLEKSEGGFYSIQFHGEETIKGHLQYVRDFSCIYEKLIKKGRSYLMHPARRDSLIKWLTKSLLPKSFLWDQERMADRLITYRCFGKTAFAIEEKTSQIKETEKKLELNKQLFGKLKTQPSRINWNVLVEDDLDCIPENYRKYVIDICKKFAEKNNLAFVESPLITLFERKEPFLKSHFHEDVQDVARIYYKERGHYGFEKVIGYVKALKNSDLNELRKDVLSKEGSLLEWRVLSYGTERTLLMEQGEKEVGFLPKAWSLCETILSQINLDVIDSSSRRIPV